jgi:DNA-binding NtrC family response regulator
MHGRILIVDDDASMCELIETDLRRRGLDSCTHGSGNSAFAALQNEDFDVVLADINMPGLNGIDLCDRVVSNRPDVPVIIITAFGSMETAIEAIRAGAYDFVTKPIELDMLALTMERALKHHCLSEQVKRLSEAVERSQGFDEIIGTSAVMQKFYSQLGRIAETDASILVTGESGTGKELIARALHKRSRRRDGPFVAVNCAAVPGALLESELFGHTRGAFTDARASRTGLFPQADGGTLFLDEIGDFPLALQPKLLRAVEERSVRPVGGDREVKFDVRLVAATNRDLESAVEEGRFREDLFFRINVIQLHLPPLRARGGDVLLLAQHFVERFAFQSQKQVVGVSKAVAGKLLGYAWPGNVRELRNAMERAVALTGYDELAVEDLPEKIRAYRHTELRLGGDDPSELVPMEEVERRYVLHVLKAVDGNKTLAAQLLGFDRKTLYRKLLRYGSVEGGHTE